MLEILVVAGITWFFGRWLISKKPVPSFLIVAFAAVFLLGIVAGFLFAGVAASMLGMQNSFGAAIIGAMRGALLGLLFGGWSIIKRYRAVRKSVRTTTEEEAK